VLQSVTSVNIEEDTEKHDYSGFNVAYGAKILLDPTFGITLDELRKKFKGSNFISKSSTLILKGILTTVENLKLDGYLKAESGHITGDHLNKETVDFIKATDSDEEIYRIRGFRPVHNKHQ
jgi:hypothetical protein